MGEVHPERGRGSGGSEGSPVHPRRSRLQCRGWRRDDDQPQRHLRARSFRSGTRKLPAGLHNVPMAPSEVSGRRSEVSGRGLETSSRLSQRSDCPFRSFQSAIRRFSVSFVSVVKTWLGLRRAVSDTLRECSEVSRPMGETDHAEARRRGGSPFPLRPPRLRVRPFASSMFAARRT